MTISNSDTQFGSIAKTLHWLTALLILTAIPLGLMATRGDISSDDGIARTAWLFSLHKTVGVLAFWVATIRILWAITQRKPAPLHPDRKTETLLAEIVHWLLYVSLVFVPLTGWIHHAAATGFAPILWPFGQTLPFVPKSEALANLSGGLHFVFTKVLGISVILHIAGAVKHHLIDKDSTLKRMLPGHSEIAPPEPHNKSKSSLLAALAIYMVALGLGTAVGLQKDTLPVQALDAVESQWTVEDGTLGVTVKQLGSDVTGSFAEWTAEINFEETSQTGDVRVVISVASLTLGSVTSDALGPDYLSAGTHPQAVFEAQIAPAETGLVATGTLSLKDVSLPVELPFTLDITDGLAMMSGSTTLNRIDFGVGATAQPTEGSLGFNVNIDVRLTARADG